MQTFTLDCNLHLSKWSHKGIQRNPASWCNSALLLVDSTAPVCRFIQSQLDVPFQDGGVHREVSSSHFLLTKTAEPNRLNSASSCNAAHKKEEHSFECPPLEEACLRCMF